MNATTISHPDTKAHKIQQTIKWIVYTLLIINFVFYIFEDWDRALHTIDADSTFLDWTSEFATSIDEAGWFLLLFMFELETYVLDDDKLRGWTQRVVRGIRLLCYLMLAHTIFAYVETVYDYGQTNPVAQVTNLCEMVDADTSFVFNLEYTKIDEENCGALSTAKQFFWLGDDPVVTDRSGLELERDLAWADLIEATSWLIILLAIEIVVRMQSRGFTEGRLMSATKGVKIFLYTLLIAIGVYWATLSHWLYLWDELLWIGGFAAIEMNVSEWRSEIQELQATA